MLLDYPQMRFCQRRQPISKTALLYTMSVSPKLTALSFLLCKCCPLAICKHISLIVNKRFGSFSYHNIPLKNANFALPKLHRRNLVCRETARHGPVIFQLYASAA